MKSNYYFYLPKVKKIVVVPAGEETAAISKLNRAFKLRKADLENFKLISNKCIIELE